MNGGNNMRSKSIDRTSETGINNFGSEMIIVNSYMKFNDKHKRNYYVVNPYVIWKGKNLQVANDIIGYLMLRN